MAVSQTLILFMFLELRHTCRVYDFHFLKKYIKMFHDYLTFGKILSIICQFFVDLNARRYNLL